MNPALKSTTWLVDDLTLRVLIFLFYILANTLYSCHMTHVTFPGISTFATGLPRFPLVTSRDMMMTSSLFCSATATKSPDLLMLKCLGKAPPAGQSWVNSRVPSWFSAKVDNESEGMAVLFFGDGLGRSKEVLFLFDTITNLLSGYGTVSRCSIRPQFSFYGFGGGLDGG